MNNNRNGRTPDYRHLAIAATVFNPLLGSVALTTNELAKRRLSNSELTSANIFYFVTISLSVFSIGSMVTAVCMLSMHVVLQQSQPRLQDESRVVLRQPNWWCKQEVVRLNITMETDVSVDMFCDTNNMTSWLNTIDKARQAVFIKQTSFVVPNLKLKSKSKKQKQQKHE
ncbi:uncharacterized protein LOC121390673 [Gigantopelta aegis]|uniref:uncharacterized protein LOC121390673 n=1 Tax=Gigantopelta aegis TaxID=1735272 RepID=UPI001B88904C|nr:uncharacterized protein LOC121390673 [Gigantopelta aegis]